MVNVQDITMAQLNDIPLVVTVTDSSGNARNATMNNFVEGDWIPGKVKLP